MTGHGHGGRPKAGLRHRITNAASESINAKIQWVKYTARGFRNRQNFVHAI
jgi:transposase